jgi:vitamin B12 transporter
MKLHGLAAAIGFVFVSNSFAQESIQIASYTPGLADEVVVTASRSPETLKETLSSTTVITREQIEQSQARDLYQILRTVPGVKLTRNGGRGGATSIALRGGNASGTLVLVDGINIESATLGQAALEQISVDQIERIEVLRGPKSSLYGSSAMGGVVQIFTRKSAGDDGIKYSLGVGSDSTRDGSISASGSTDSSRFNFTASHVVSDGIDAQYRDDETSGSSAFDDDGHHRSAISFNLDQDLGDFFTANVIFSKNEGESEIDDYFYADSFPYSLFETTLASIALDFNIERFSSKLQYGKLKDSSENFSDNISINPIYDFIETIRDQGVWENSFHASDLFTINFGLDYIHEEVASTNAYTQTKRDNFGSYVNNRLDLGVFSWSVGLRHDDNEQFGSKLTGDTAFGVEILEDVTATLSYGTAYKAPSFNDLYWPVSLYSAGNPSLQPEEIETYELGLDAYQDWGNASFHIYKSYVDDLIDWAPTDSGQWTPQNIDSVKIRGAELQYGVEFMEVFWSASFTYEKATNTTAKEDLIRKPRRRFSFDADKTFGAFSAGVTLYAQSQHYEDLGADRGVVPGYGDVALRGAWQVNDVLKLRANVENVFDNDYVEIYGYNNTGRFVMVYLDYQPN